MIVPRKSIRPSPSIAALRWPSGARSPEAPTEPWLGMQGKASASSKASSRSTTSRLTPEWPRARPITLVAMASRTTGRLKSSPRPQLCDITRLR
jgi:hypothetical protein